MAKRPRDLNQLAKLVVDIASGEVEDTVSLGMKSKEATPAHRGGVAGGKSRAAAMTPEQRVNIANLLFRQPRISQMERWGAESSFDGI
jgi:hypothetical protein